MILKATCASLCIILVCVIAISYYMNNEGFLDRHVISQNDLVDKQSVKCIKDVPKGPGYGAVYQYIKNTNTLNWYPTPEIAASWDLNWSNAKYVEDCSTMKLGSTLSRNTMNTGAVAGAGAGAAGLCSAPGAAGAAGAAKPGVASAAGSAPGPVGLVGPVAGSAPGPVGLVGPVAGAGAVGLGTVGPVGLGTVGPVPSKVSLSDTGYTAMVLQQKSDLLKDIQKIVKNEILSNRATEYIDKNAVSVPTLAIAQGAEYNANASCDHDMSQYIKKDAIPCWGCSLDY